MPAKSSDDLQTLLPSGSRSDRTRPHSMYSLSLVTGIVVIAVALLVFVVGFSRILTLSDDAEVTPLKTLKPPDITRR